MEYLRIEWINDDRKLFCKWWGYNGGDIMMGIERFWDTQNYNQQLVFGFLSQPKTVKFMIHEHLAILKKP